MASKCWHLPNQCIQAHTGAAGHSMLKPALEPSIPTQQVGVRREGYCTCIYALTLSQARSRPRLVGRTLRGACAS